MGLTCWRVERKCDGHTHTDTYVRTYIHTNIIDIQLADELPVCKPVVIPIARAFTHRACCLSDRTNQTCLILAIWATTGLQTVNLTVYTWRSVCNPVWTQCLHTGFDFYIDGNKLLLVSFCRDLGVTVSHDLKPTTHIKQIVTKAHTNAPIQFAVLFRETMISSCVLSL